jgi:hypothetical protein
VLHSHGDDPKISHGEEEENAIFRGCNSELQVYTRVDHRIARCLAENDLEGHYCCRAVAGSLEVDHVVGVRVPVQNLHQWHFHRHADTGKLVQAMYAVDNCVCVVE